MFSSSYLPDSPENVRFEIYSSNYLPDLSEDYFCEERKKLVRDENDYKTRSNTPKPDSKNHLISPQRSISFTPTPTPKQNKEQKI